MNNKQAIDSFQNNETKYFILIYTEANILIDQKSSLFYFLSFQNTSMLNSMLNPNEGFKYQCKIIVVKRFI
jgi:hypothetical protein